MLYLQQSDLRGRHYIVSLDCTDTLGAYVYNNRVQPVLIELGSTSNAAADYCLVYNYYTNVGNPTSCAIPSQAASGNNGNVMGYAYYDAEGHITTMLQGGSTYAEFVYNARGQAVETTYPVYNNTEVVGVFGPAGRESGYYDGGSGDWYDRDIWAAGRMIAQSFPASYQGGFTGFLHANALGSDTQVTNQAGSPTMDILYYPWGEAWTHLGYESDSHFAGFQQSGNDMNFTPNRRYSNTDGRWFTPDPLGGDITNPQSLNRYAYVLNNPTTLIDPSGLGPQGFSPGDSGGEACLDPAYADTHVECQSPGSPYCVDTSFISIGCNAVIGSVSGMHGNPRGGGGAAAGNSSFPGGQTTKVCANIPGSPTSCSIQNFPPIIGPVPVVATGLAVLAWLKTFLPHVPLTISATEIASAQITYIPATKTVCAGLGVGAAWPPEKIISVGSYLHGNLLNPVPVLQGWSTNVSASLEPTIGYQVTTNANGTLGGPSFSGPGVSASRTWSACGSVPTVP